jgi:predicted metal-binding membrane protein
MRHNHPSIGLHLAGCREGTACGHALEAHSGSAFRHGLRLGLHCNYCCASLTAILLAVGVMDVRSMILITGAITAERAEPKRAERWIVSSAAL